MMEAVRSGARSAIRLDEFAEDNRQVGDGDDDSHIANHLAVTAEYREAVQPRPETLAEGSAAVSARDDADHGDADLNRAQEVAWVVDQPECAAGAADTLVRHALKPGLAG